jgi:hypothetical protein
MTECSRSLGHGCLLELAWAFTTAAINCLERRLDEYLFQFRLVLTIGRNGERTEKLYHLLSRLSMRFAKSWRARLTVKKLNSHLP